MLSPSNLTDLSLDPVQPRRSPFAGHLGQLDLVQPLTVIDTDTEVESHIHQSTEQLHCCRDTHNSSKTSAFGMSVLCVLCVCVCVCVFVCCVCVCGVWCCVCVCCFRSSGINHQGDLPASVQVCLKARTLESESSVSSEVSVFQEVAVKDYTVLTLGH